MIKVIAPPPAITAYPHGGNSVVSGSFTESEGIDRIDIETELEFVVAVGIVEVLTSLGAVTAIGEEGGAIASPVVAHVD